MLLGIQSPLLWVSWPRSDISLDRAGAGLWASCFSSFYCKHAPLKIVISLNPFLFRKFLACINYAKSVLKEFTLLQSVSHCESETLDSLRMLYFRCSCLLGCSQLGLAGCCPGEWLWICLWSSGLVVNAGQFFAVCSPRFWSSSHVPLPSRLLISPALALEHQPFVHSSSVFSILIN